MLALQSQLSIIERTYYICPYTVRFVDETQLESEFPLSAIYYWLASTCSTGCSHGLSKMLQPTFILFLDLLVAIISITCGNRAG